MKYVATHDLYVSYNRFDSEHEHDDLATRVPEVGVMYVGGCCVAKQCGASIPVGRDPLLCGRVRA